MTDRAPPRRRRRRQLSEADRAIWAQVAETLRPLSPDRPTATVAPVALPSPSPPAPVAAPAVPEPVLNPVERRLVPQGRAEPTLRWSLAVPDRPAPPARGTPGLDAATAKRLARGKREPEARLDLHGLTADRAHAALSRFIHDSAHAGLRCVLVVTGMGRSEDGRQRGDGVLRRETPRWLGVAPLNAMIVGVFQAHPRHGGAGALYVYLRRKR